MPHIDAQLFKKKGVRKTLTLELDDGDSILDCIKSALAEHNIKEANVESAEGTFKDGVINFFERNSYGTADLKGHQVMRVSGIFKLSYGDLYGTMKISTFDKPPLQGTFVKGHANAGFKYFSILAALQFLQDHLISFQLHILMILL